MMSKTHAALAVAVCSLTLSTADPLTLGVAACASQLPDVDTSTSLVGRVLFPLSHFLEERFAHRTLTHSFLATLFIAAAFSPLLFIKGDVASDTQDWYAIIIGFFCGWFGDVFTKTGVAAFYPASYARLVVPANPKYRLQTASGSEYFVFLLLCGAIVFSINLHSAGGIFRSVNNLFAMPAGAIQLYNQAGADHLIIAHITGRNIATNQPIEGDFEVVEPSGSDLLVRDASGTLYLAGEQANAQMQIYIDKVEARIGEPITNEAHELRFEEDELAPKLKALPKGERAYITGDLEIKNPPPLFNVPMSQQTFNSITISSLSATTGASNKTVKLHDAAPEQVNKLLGDQFVTGYLHVRVVHAARVEVK